MDILTLQRLAGNQAVVSMLGAPNVEEPATTTQVTEPTAAERVKSAQTGAQPMVQRAPDEPEFTPAEVTQYRGRINAGRSSAQDFTDKFNQFLDNAGRFITAYRGKASWVNGSYTLAYGHHTTLVGQLGASAAADQILANLAVGLALNVLTGGVAEILETMDVIGHAAAFWGDQLVNTVAGAVAAPNIPAPVTTATSAPAFKELKGLQKLDELNQHAFKLASDGSRAIVKVLLEAGKLQDALMAPAGDAGSIEKTQFVQRMDTLGTLFDQIPPATTQIVAGNAKFDTLWATFFQSPWPSDMKCEQDIWIVWMAEQKTYDNPEMPTHEGLLGAFDEMITPKLLRKREFQDHMFAIGGDAADVASHNLDTMIKFAAEGRKPKIATYWASVFME